MTVEYSLQENGKALMIIRANLPELLNIQHLPNLLIHESRLSVSVALLMIIRRSGIVRGGFQLSIENWQLTI